MTIISGFKVVLSDKSYLFVENETDAQRQAERWNSGDNYQVIPCRYVRKNKWSFPVMVEEENKIGALYELFARGARIYTVENENAKHQDPKFFNWDVIIEAGKSYLVGDNVSTKQYLKTHTTQSSDWQIIAHEYVKENPDKMLIIETSSRSNLPNFIWKIWLEGDHVVFGLPHEDHGGEKHWVSHVDCPTRKVLNNED